MFQSVFEGFESFLFVPNTTSRSGVHIHDSIDSKRTMIVVIIALLPAMLFGMYNVGYQHYLSIGELASTSFWSIFFFGFLAVLPKIVVAYVVGLGIEFTAAQIRHHEIQEGFLVSGMLIPMIVPVDTPLWMIAVATAFAVIFAKEVFGGTGMNIFNVALVTRAFLFSRIRRKCRAMRSLCARPICSVSVQDRLSTLSRELPRWGRSLPTRVENLFCKMLSASRFRLLIISSGLFPVR